MATCDRQRAPLQGGGADEPPHLAPRRVDLTIEIVPANRPARLMNHSEDPGNDDLDLSGDENPYLIVQRQLEDGDGGVCYIETHDHDTYSGHFRLRLIRFTPTRFAFEIARKDHKHVEVTCDLDAKRFDEVQRIVRIIFGVQS
jgi:hypothetical protein